MSGFSFATNNEPEPVDASYLQARFDAVQDMFDELEEVSIDMIAVVLGVDMSKYKARQEDVMKGYLNGHKE